MPILSKWGIRDAYKNELTPPLMLSSGLTERNPDCIG